MSSAYFLPLVTLPVIVDKPGCYLSRIGELIVIHETSQSHYRSCAGEYENGVKDRWHCSGRLYTGMLSNNDIVERIDTDLIRSASDIPAPA